MDVFLSSLELERTSSFFRNLLDGQHVKSDVLLAQFAQSTTHSKHRARSLRQDLGRGAGEVGNQPQLAMRGTHSENDQVSCLSFRHFNNSLHRQGELPPELKEVFRMAPWLGFRGRQ